MTSYTIRKGHQYILNADIPDGWAFNALSTALAPALAKLGVLLVERPNESELGGLVLGDDLPLADGDALAEQVRRIVDGVCTSVSPTTDTPETYWCHGCGATIAADQATASGWVRPSHDDWYCGPCGPEDEWRACEEHAAADVMIWTVPPTCQGQIVEVAYGIYDGMIYRRRTDRSVSPTAHQYESRAALDEDDPVNEEPS